MISAIVTTYKRKPDIVLRAINSILTQTYKDIEIIVVDDSPNDYEYRDQLLENIININQKIDSPIRYIRHEKNKGACAARNSGLYASKGEFVAFLDDDDEWLPEKIEMELKQFRDDVGMVYCNAYIVNDEKNEKQIRSFPHYSGFIIDKLIEQNFIGSTSFPLIRKTTLFDIGGFDEKLESAQDYDVWLRIAQNCKIEYVDLPLVNYHFHTGEQITHNPDKRIQGLLRIYEKNKDSFDNNKRATADLYRNLAPNYSLRKEFRLALKYMFLAFMLKPLEFRNNVDCLMHVIVYFIYKEDNWR